MTEQKSTIFEIIGHCKNKTWVIPEFQRNYVWEREQIRLLIDSIYRGYTIGSPLLWKTDFPLASRRVGGAEFEINFAENKKGEYSTFILDGQQRLTSLLLVLTNLKVYKKGKKKVFKLDLFFDVKQKRFVFGDEKIEIRKYGGSKEELFVSELAESDEYKFEFVNLKELIDFKTQKTTKFSHLKTQNEEVSRLSKEELEKRLVLSNTINQYENMLRDLNNRIMDRDVQEIHQSNVSIQDVLTIFERINTKNTRLNVFDIMVAKSFKKIDECVFNLREYIKKVKKQTITNNEIPIKHTVEITDDENDAFDDELLLRAILTILKKKFKQSEILEELTPEEMQENLSRINKIVHSTSDFMKDEFSIPKKEISLFKPMFSFLIYIFAHKDFEKNRDNQFKELVRKWFWNTTLYNRYPGSQIDKIEEDVKMFEMTDNKFIILKEIIKSRNKLEIDSETGLLDAEYGQNKGLALYIKTLLKTLNPIDFDNWASCGIEKKGNKKINLHHIFPEHSEIGLKFGDNIHNIANIALITNDLNNRIINNKNPNKYITECEKLAGSNFLKIMESHLIDQYMIDNLKND